MGDGVRTVDVAKLVDERRLSAANYKLIVLSWLITVFDGFDQMMVSFTAPYMRDELALDKTMLGNVFSAGIAGMLIGGFLFSWLADRIGRRPAVIWAAYIFGFLTIATALANSYEALLALRFLDGLAIGGMLPIAWALNIEFVPKRMRSTVVTVIMMGYSFGSAAAGPLTNWIAPYHGWQGVYVVGGVGTPICATALFFYLPESVRFLVSKGRRPDLVAATMKRLDPGLDILADDRFILGDEPPARGNFHVRELFEGDLRLITPLLWGGYLVSSLAIYFSSSWGPSLLEDLHVPRQTAALVSSANGLLGAAMGLALMRFTDRKGPISVVFCPALAVPVLLILGLGFVSGAAFIPFVMLGAIFISGGHFGILSICGIFYPSAIRASGAGWATSIAKFGAVLGPIIGAMVLSSGMPLIRSYALLAVCPAILALCALGIAAVVRGRVGREPVPDAVAVS